MKYVMIALLAACLLHVVLYFGWDTGIFRGIVYPIINHFKTKQHGAGE